MMGVSHHFLLWRRKSTDSATKPGGFSGALPGLLAEEKVYLSVRGESVRVAPHLYNNDDEIDRLFAALRKVG